MSELVLKTDPAKAGAESATLEEARLTVGHLLEGVVQKKLIEAAESNLGLPLGTERKDTWVIIRAIEEREALAVFTRLKGRFSQRAFDTYKENVRRAGTLPKRTQPEKELEDFLVRNLHLIDFPKPGEPALTCKGQQVATASGIIDIDAQRGTQPVTVELKAQDFNVTETVQQLQKYLEDRSTGQVIFVAPRIPATLHFCLKSFFEQGRLFYVTVSGSKGRYTFKPFDPTTAFTAERMAKIQASLEQRAHEPTEAPGGELISLFPKGAPTRSDTRGGEAPRAAQAQGATPPADASARDPEVTPAATTESANRSEELSSVNGPEHGSAVRREFTEAKEESRSNESIASHKTGEVDLFLNRAALAERERVLSATQRWPQPGDRLYTRLNSPALAQFRLEVVALINRHTPHGTSAIAPADCPPFEHLRLPSPFSLERETTRLIERFRGLHTLSESLLQHPNVAHIFAGQQTGYKNRPEKNEPDATFDRVTTQRKLAFLLRGVVHLSEFDRHCGLLELDSKAAQIYQVGCKQISQARLDSPLSTPEVDLPPRELFAEVLAYSAGEDRLFGAIAEVLSSGRFGSTPHVSGGREISLEALRARVAALPHGGRVLDPARILDSTHTRLIAVLERQLKTLDHCNLTDLPQISMIPRHLKPSRSFVTWEIEVVDARSVLRTYSPELGCDYVVQALDRELDREKQRWSDLSRVAGYSLDLALDAAGRSLVYSRAKLLFSILRDIDEELAVQYALYGTDGGSLLHPTTLIGREREAHHTVAEALLQLYPPTSPERPAADLSGADICASLPISGGACVAAAISGNDRHRNQLEAIERSHSAALASVGNLGQPSPLDPLSRTESPYRNRGRSPSRPVWAHEISEVLEQHLCSATGALNGGTGERHLDSAIEILGELARENDREASVSRIASQTDGGLRYRCGHAALRDVLCYRHAAASMLATVDPTAARGYLSFTLKSVEQLIPGALLRLRESAPSITEAIKEGDPSMAAELTLYLELDRKVFAHLLDEAQKRATAAHSSTSESRRAARPAPKRSPLDVLRASLSAPVKGPVHKAAEEFLNACAAKNVDESALKSMAETMRQLGLGSRLDTPGGLRTYQAESFLKNLTARVSTGAVLSPQIIQWDYELAKSRPPSIPPQ